MPVGDLIEPDEAIQLAHSLSYLRDRDCSYSVLCRGLVNLASSPIIPPASKRNPQFGARRTNYFYPLWPLEFGSCLFAGLSQERSMEIHSGVQPRDHARLRVESLIDRANVASGGHRGEPLHVD
jgi:hypothetical protein